MLIATAALAESKEGAEFMRQMLPESYDNESGLYLGEVLQKLFSYTTDDALHTDFDVAYSNFFSETFGWAVVSSYPDEVKAAAVEFLKFRTEYNKNEKETLFNQDLTDKPQVLKDYLKAFSRADQIVPNYQVKWNSILQEETLGVALPLLAEQKITPEKFVQMVQESVLEFEAEQ